MATLGDLRLRVSSKLSLDNTDGSDEQQLMDSWANEGVVKVLLATHCRVSPASMALIAGTADYDLPTNVLAVNKLLDGNSTPLERVSVEDMYELRRASATDATGGASYRYAVDGSTLLMVWPTPATSDPLTAYFVPKPTPMSAGTHDPSLAAYGGVPSEFHKALELWMLAEGADYDDDQSSAQGERYRQRYQLELREANTAQRFKGGRKLAPARVGRRRRFQHSPSQDS